MPSVASHGVDITFSNLTEQDVLVDYLSVESYVDNFCEVVSMVNPDVRLLSWRSDSPERESSMYVLIIYKYRVCIYMLFMYLCYF